MSGSTRKPRISLLGDMTGARKDRKLEILKNSLASTTDAMILATKAIVVTNHPNEGPKSLGMTHEQ